MRFPKPRQRQVRTKVLIMTGGLNEVVTNLELKEGELHECKNYMEMDGPYHGYTSIAGYEIFDGKSLASSIPAIPLPDEGLDDLTVLLIEAPVIEDISSSAHTITNYGSVTDSLNYKFEPSSYQYPQESYIEVNSLDSGSFNPGFNLGFDRSFTGERSHLNLYDNWTIDWQMRPRPRSGDQIIFEKVGSYKCLITAEGFIQFLISSDGISYDYSIESEVSPIITSLFSHISVASKENTIRIAINGIPIVDINDDPIELAVPTIVPSPTNLTIGNGPSAEGAYQGNLDEFRISSDYRWITSFIPPAQRYATGSYSEINWDDIDREEQRAKIQQVPGEGPILGLHIYAGQLYALRNQVGGAAASLWMALRVYLLPSDDYSGPVDEVNSQWTLIDDTFNPDGNLDARNWRFSGSFLGQEVMLMCDGVSIPRIWDGTTMHLLTSGGSEDATGLPEFSTEPGYPRYAKKMHVFDNRWLLGYESDDIFLSSKISPLDWSLGYGDQLLIGDDITNLQELPGEAMCIICRNSIKILEKLEVPTSTAATPDYSFRVTNYSREAGGIENTSERALGTIIYADDRGIINFKATDAYGDFEAAAISKKVNRIFLDKKLQITTSLVDKQLNQYRLYFDDGSGLVFTFLEEELKGATYVEYDIPILHATEGEDRLGNVWKVVSSEDGSVYVLDSGTSFNGEPILTDLKTSFYHYASPRYWKQFMRMIFELTASRGTTFRVRSIFDYNDDSMPTTQWWLPELKGLGGTWGDDNWSEFIWGGAAVQRMVSYIRGHGTNMSIELETSSKYNSQHIVHNVIVDYQMENLQE